jgi:hypothetical protein
MTAGMVIGVTVDATCEMVRTLPSGAVLIRTPPCTVHLWTTHR